MVVASIVSRAHSAGWVSISAIFEVFCGVVPVPWTHSQDGSVSVHRCHQVQALQVEQVM